ncbi:hypothetical protein H5410_016263 [Solanum commersonii]|uniref:Reverse transcriptase zinc-binding domain-containing protein n=1 Tax=Solanum commersonii TaxID=4109 RepID=A0A9J5ZX33_SOLCO|nr:hypothetical protein H5410_016263 [Solanum commersonii]
MFTQIRQSTLPSLRSDHNPIVLTCGDEVFKKSYFKFEKWWLNVEGFRDKVKEWWGSFNVTGSPDFILASKLSYLKKKLKEWSKENRGNWRVKKEHLLEQIGSLEDIQEHRALTDDEQLLKAHIAMEYEEIHWRQRSIIQWIKNGDKNTKFFHRMATSHKRNNTIESLVINGEESSDPVAIKNEIVDFYQILYKETESWRPSLNILDVQTITEEEQILLSRDFEEKEVLEGIKQCVVDKARGPDGYTMAFFGVFWETIKDDAFSGLKVNWRKSSIFPIKEVQQIEDLASILKCKIKKLPIVYLGMPLGSEHKAEKNWDGIIEKTKKKLAIWKSQYLSLGGRVTLINSVLDSLPTYVMSIFPIPNRIVMILDALSRNFLWQGNKLEKGFNLVKWYVVQQRKKNGGLGVRNLKVHNMSLLSKWLWRYSQEEQALWKEIINHKYGQEDFWCTSEVNETYGVRVWRTIRNLWESLKNNSKIVVGKGDKTKLWLDDWCGNGILRDLFPILFSICTNTNSKIEEMWSPQGWNIIFRRLLNDWEIDGMVECLGLISGFPSTTLEPDRLAWEHHKDGIFSVNRLYNWGLKRCARRSIGPWNTIWKSVAPAKVKCFTWLVARKKMFDS